MSENNNKLTLFELNKLVKDVITKSLPGNYWVMAEISEINEHPSGHCYLELIQKDENTDSIKARVRANIWSYTYRMLKPYFETTTNRALAKGMKILVNSQVVFHELYGYSLNIIDIEPSYTLGDIELKRRETIERLIADGVMDMNKELELPVPPKRIAIISSPTAAGLQDFVHQLTNNQFGYVFEYELFPSTMQGEDAEKSIVNSLSNIYEKVSNFDVAAIVRGGGAQTDLSCFDSYQLASNIAQFPLPVLTGIGHDKDVSITDMVAFSSLKTPTAVAEFLISKFTAAEATAAELALQLLNATSKAVDKENFNLTSRQLKIQQYGSTAISENIRIIYGLSNSIPYLITRIITTTLEVLRTKQGKTIFALNATINGQNTTIKSNLIQLKSVVPQKLQAEKTKQHFWLQTAQNLNPEALLQKGYSITYFNGKALKNSTDVVPGDKIVTKLKNGTVLSITTGE
ncbi:MAG: exodeoxyribonuclease VII large subunit [Bacteroidales bacterium]